MLPSNDRLVVFSLSTVLAGMLMPQSTIAAELVGRAVLPADTFSPGPTSGQLVTGNTNGRVFPLVTRQPVQGVSAVLPGPKPGTYLVMQDNGFGSKVNSPDVVLRFYAVEPDFRTASGGSGNVFPVNLKTGQRLGAFLPEGFFQLNDRRRRVGLAIVADQTVYPGSVNSTNPNGIPVDVTLKSRRLLTGGDFDLESFRKDPNGSYWFGEEFGPFLLNVSESGELLRPPVAIPNLLNLGNNPLVQSPDNPAFASLPTDADRVRAANLPRSRGFEGMALNASGTRLYPLLEGALTTDPDNRRLLMYEYDLAGKRFTGKTFSYRLESPTHAIGDLTAINDNEFIVIERDNLQGDPNNPAFTNPAQFKRLYKIDLRRTDAAGLLVKEPLADLLNIRDPNNVGGNGTVNGRFTFPFQTIESVLPLNDRVLLVINDNNYPFSIGRTPGQPDSSEFILLRLDQALNLDPRLVLSPEQTGPRRR